MTDRALLLATPPQEGSTYFVAAKPYDGWVKIGRSTRHAPLRLAALQTGNPHKLTIRALWPADFEWHLHRYYAAFRGNGEWFALPLALVERAAMLTLAEDRLEQMMRLWKPGDVWRAAGNRRLGTTSLAWRFASAAYANGVDTRLRSVA